LSEAIFKVEPAATVYVPVPAFVEVTVAAKPPEIASVSTEVRSAVNVLLPVKVRSAFTVVDVTVERFAPKVDSKAVTDVVPAPVIAVTRSASAADSEIAEFAPTVIVFPEAIVAAAAKVTVPDDPVTAMVSIVDRSPVTDTLPLLVAATVEVVPATMPDKSAAAVVCSALTVTVPVPVTIVLLRTAAVPTKVEVPFRLIAPVPEVAPSTLSVPSPEVETRAFPKLPVNVFTPAFAVVNAAVTTVPAALEAAIVAAPPPASASVKSPPTMV
jgi:hypothetical protein